jgi:chitinase
MSTTTWFSRFAKSFSQVRKHAVQYLALAALSCVLVKAQPASNYIVGYWEGSGTPNVSHLTHLNYAFASIVQGSSGYTCQLPVAAATLTKQFKAFKVTNPKLKILVSVGGAGQSPATFTNASKDNNFATACVAATLGQLGGSADGIDIDWEFPSTTDQQNFTNLMTALRSALPLNGLLTVAVGMGPTDNGQAAQNANVPFTSVLDTVNFFNVMAYDVASTAATTFNAPLFAPNITGYGTYNGTVDTTITNLITTRGVPPGQIVLGIPFYGIAYPSVPTKGSNFGLFETPVAKVVPGSTTAVYDLAVPYNQIATQLTRSTVTKRCDTGSTSGVVCPTTWGQALSAAPTAGSQETWIYDTNGIYGFGPSVTTFDDQGSIAAKVKYAVDKELGGVMVWELMQDTADTALLNTIANCMPSNPDVSDPSTYSFESSAQGWTTITPYTKVATSTTEAFLGTHSLGVAMGAVVQVGTKQTQEYSAATVVYVASPAIQSTSHVAVFHIWIPATAKLSAIDPFIADSKWNYLSGAWTSTFTPNAWNTFEVSIPAGSNPAYLGVEFDASAFWMGSCYIDSVMIY